MLNFFAYNFHTVISRLGNKITSLVLVFYFLRAYPNDSLTLSIALFLFASVPSVIFSKVYEKIIKSVADYKILAYLDFAGAALVLAMLLNLGNLPLLLALYFVLTIIYDVTARLDSSLLFSITKNHGKERGMIRQSSGIVSLLSVIAPSVCSFFIQFLGYGRSLVMDVISFVIGGGLYYFLSKRVKIYSENPENKNAENGGDPAGPCGELKIICILMLSVAFLGDLEGPLIFNYLSIVRNFSEAEVGIGMTCFSLGMTLGSFLFKFIRRVSPKNFIIFMLLDGFFTVLLSCPIGKILIIVCYLIQGVFVMFMMIAFKIFIQSCFSDGIKVTVFRNRFAKFSALASLGSYALAYIAAWHINDSGKIFRFEGIAELCLALVFWVVISKREAGRCR
jgi:hypothetical protein